MQTNDASAYRGGAFKGDSYGLGKRLIVFNNASAKKSYRPIGSNAYSRSLIYEFTLYYDSVQTEQKLWGQPVNVCKEVDSNWYFDDNYEILERSEKAPVGYIIIQF